MSEPVVVIEPGSRQRRYLAEVWAHRRLLYYLAWRDMRIRYTQTALGLAWGLLRPLLAMVAYTLVFGGLADLPTQGDTPYALLVLSGLLPWQLFSTGILHASQSLVLNHALVTKTWFPRLILPVAAVSNGVFDFLAALLVLVVLLFATGDPPSVRVLLVPVFAVVALLPAVGIGLWLSALNARYRDFAYLVPFALQLGQFVSPVGFASFVVPDAYREVYAVNPLVAAIDGFRWALLDAAPAPRLFDLGLSLGLSFALVLSGVWFFRRREGSFADYL